MAICRVTESEQEQCRAEVFSVEEARLVSRGTIPPVSTRSSLVPSADGLHVLEWRLRRGTTGFRSIRDLVVWHTSRSDRAVRAEPIWPSVEGLGAEISEARLLDGGRLLILEGLRLRSMS